MPALAFLIVASHAGAAAAASPAACASVPYGRATAPAGEYDRALPPNPDGPTLTGIGFRVLEIRDIDPVHQSFHLRGYAHTTWCDPRLAFESADPANPDRVYAGPAAEAMVQGEIWYPAAFPVNQTGSMRITERLLRIRPDGTVEQDLNISVPLTSRFDLRRFPFDTQVLTLRVESFQWPKRTLQILDDPTRTGFEPGLSLPEWELVSVSGRVSDVYRMRSHEPFSLHTLGIEISRRPGFYVWKVFLPLLIIVAISWSIFWMTEESFSSRSRISATGVLTIVAYQFVFAADMPRIGYLTVFDRVMIASFGVLAVTVLQSLLISPYQKERPELALRLDRISRWAFPLAYAAILVAIFVASS